jgi:hypothetical protein
VGPRAGLDGLEKRQISCFCSLSLVTILTTLHPTVVAAIVVVDAAAAFSLGSGTEDGDKNFEFQFIL